MCLENNSNPIAFAVPNISELIVPSICFVGPTVADKYKAKISWPNAFSTSPNLTDSVTWDGETEVKSHSVAGMSAYEAAKVEYDNVTEFDLTLAGSTWFKVTSEAKYGVGKSLPGGEYKANVVAECIAD